MSQLLLSCLLLACVLLMVACQDTPTTMRGTTQRLPVASSQPARAPLSFYKSQDSDDWVRHTLFIQPAYTRVLLVSRDAHPPMTIMAAPPDLNAREGQPQPAGREYRVDRVFATLQEAADESRGGDLIAVTPGIYAGFHVYGERPETGDGRYIHFKALGWPGAVIIDRPPALDNQAWFIFLTATHHIIVEGFNLDGRAYANVPANVTTTRPADEHDPVLFATPEIPAGPQPSTLGTFVPEPPAEPATTRPRATTAPSGPDGRRPRTGGGGGGSRSDWAGIMLGSGFGQSGQLTHHIIILNNYSHHHTKWGLHATDTHTCLLQGNLFGFSRDEHSCYVSNGSDNYVIRRNVFFASNGCALHCNIDPASCLGDTMAHPAMKGMRRNDGSAAWMRDFQKEATRIFGENAYPDGRGLNFIIEENVMNRNGIRGGGAGINLGCVQESLIQNNLIYDDWHHGIALYNNFERSDRAVVMAGHSSPQQVTGPEVLPYLGARDNTIRNNTVIVTAPGYAAVAILAGSYRGTFRNNIFLNDPDDSIHTDSHSLWHLDSGYNVAGRVSFSMVNPQGFWNANVRERPTPLPPEFKALATHLDENNHSTLGLTREQLAPQFVRDNKEPWVVFEGSWWKLNPNRPDFHPRADAKLLAGTGDATQMPARDVEGQMRSRTAADIGAYRAAK